jgi:sulfite reductase (NADPH) hemoprotein beta-component
VGHVGILGVDKHGEEFYQVTIGGSQAGPAALGRVIGPSLKQDDIPDIVERMIHKYLEIRDSEVERFIDVVQRVGIEPFKEVVYGAKPHSSAQAH